MASAHQTVDRSIFMADIYDKMALNQHQLGFSAMSKSSLSIAKQYKRTGENALSDILVAEKRNAEKPHITKRQTYYTGCCGLIRYKWNKHQIDQTRRRAMKAGYRLEKIIAKTELLAQIEEEEEDDDDGDEDEGEYIKDILRIVPQCHDVVV